MVYMYLYENYLLCCNPCVRASCLYKSLFFSNVFPAEVSQLRAITRKKKKKKGKTFFYLKKVLTLSRIELSPLSSKRIIMNPPPPRLHCITK